MIALRDKVVLNTDAAIGKEQARMRIVFAGGAAREIFVERARGSSGRPLSDAELEAKFRGLAAGVLSQAQIETTLRLCRSLDTCADVAELARTVAG